MMNNQVIIAPSGHITMINPGGNVRFVRLEEAELKKNEGWKTIINPKEWYYPQHDQSVKNNVPLSENLLDNIDPDELLEVVEV